ncbi:MAG: 3-oxoacyl-ACP reductase FabG [Peptococcaceae bacterium]|nr:3-oxoacyl-ACP reductase FabG [Peptococcaceae bacterium]
MTEQKKEIVLVTGASGGIGKAVAEKFALAGYPVVLHYHKGTERAEALQKELAEQGCIVMTQQADLRSSTQVTQMIERITQQWGPVGILINNAGIAQQKLFTDITDEEWRDMFAVHVDGAFYCSRAVLPAMIQKKRGCIINVSSMWGQIGGSCEVHYSAAKGALQAMTQALAKEVGPSGIRVNCVAPGVILTEMNTRMFDEETLDALREETPLEKLGAAEDVASMIYYLSTEEAGFITGQIIGVNGGMVI